MDVPFERAYWADPGRLLAGPYPAEYHPADTQRNLSRLVDLGIRSVVSLMQAREESHDAEGRSNYVQVLERIAGSRGVACHWERFEIHDMSVPDLDSMHRIQAAIDASLEQGRPVYAHCWGGRGRTGLVVGAYLIRRGLATPENFVQVVTDLRGPGMPPSPETSEQVEFVRTYARTL
jgi:hypothetical protein